MKPVNLHQGKFLFSSILMQWKKYQANLFEDLKNMMMLDGQEMVDFIPWGTVPNTECIPCSAILFQNWFTLNYAGVVYFFAVSE